MKNSLIEAGNTVNEILWHLPIFDEHRKAIKRDYCDLSNMGKSFNFFFINLNNIYRRWGGASVAAAFLVQLFYFILLSINRKTLLKKM